MVPSQRVQIYKIFRKEDTLVYCTDVLGLIEAFGMSYQTEDWRLFMYLSKTSMKATLLYNGPSVSSTPVAYSTEMSKTYKNIKILLKLIKYYEHN